MTKTPENIFPRIKTLVLHAFFRSYIAHNIGIQHGCIQKMRNEIIREIERGVQNGEFSEIEDILIDDSTLTEFLLRCRSPKLPQARVYEYFLIKKKYLRSGDLDELENRYGYIFLNSEDIKIQITDNPPLDDGVYFYEGDAYSQTFFSSLFLVPDEDRRGTRMWLSKKIYNLGEESFDAYKKRMNNGAYDCCHEYFGYLSSKTCVTLYRKDKEQEKIVGSYNVKGAALELIWRDDFTVREHMFLNQRHERQKDAEKNTPILTERQKSNIVMKNIRLFDNSINIPHLSFDNALSSDGGEGLCGNKVMDNNKKLLEAARSGDAVGIVLALANGADINTQDPETGDTALHCVARAHNLICLSALTGTDIQRIYTVERIGIDPEVVMLKSSDTMQAIYESLEQDGVKNISEIDLRVRISQTRLDPIIPNNDHLYPSELRIERVITDGDLMASEENVRNSPILSENEDVWCHLFWLEEKAFRVKGLKFMTQVPVPERERLLALHAGHNNHDDMSL